MSSEVFGSSKNIDENGRGSFKRKEESNVRGFGDIGARDNVRVPSNNAEVRDAPDTKRIRQQGPGEYEQQMQSTSGRKRKTDWANRTDEDNGRSDERPDFETFPTQPPICGGDDGLPRKLDGITFPKWRKESIKAYGNAIVPQVAFEIFKAIQKMEDLKNQEEEV